VFTSYDHVRAGLAAQAFLKSIFRKKYYKTKEGGRKREIDSFFISYEKKRESERDRKRERCKTSQ